MKLEAFGRYSNPSLLILASLAGGAKHGYGMMGDIEAMTEVRIGPGTLYGALVRLEGAGLIRALPPRDRRRPYALTAKGATVLRDQLTVLHQLASTGLKRLASR